MVGIETIVIVWMDDTRLPKQIFYFSLKKRHLKSGGKKKRFKDVFKSDMKKYIGISNLESNVMERNI